MTTNNGNGLTFNNPKPTCYHSSDAASALSKLLAVTGIDNTGVPIVLNNMGLQIFRLILKEDN